MSAIQMICPACGGNYLAGVVGSTPWPPHECPLKAVSAAADFYVKEVKNGADNADIASAFSALEAALFGEAA